MLARRIPAVRLIAGGLTLAACGMLLQTQVGPTEGTGLLAAGLVITMFGIAVPMALLMGFVMGAAPPEKAGSAASINEMGTELGIALGVAVGHGRGAIPDAHCPAGGGTDRVEAGLVMTFSRHRALVILPTRTAGDHAQ